MPAGRVADDVERTAGSLRFQGPRPVPKLGTPEAMSASLTSEDVSLSQSLSLVLPEPQLGARGLLGVGGAVNVTLSGLSPVNV